MIVVIDSQTGKVVSGPEIHARGFAEDEQHLRGHRRPDHRGPRQGGLGGRRRQLPAAADHPARRRPLGQRHPPPAADDHPGRPRGLRCQRARRSATAGDGRRSATSSGASTSSARRSARSASSARSTPSPGQPIDFGPIGRRPRPDRQGPRVRRDRRGERDQARRRPHRLPGAAPGEPHLRGRPPGRDAPVRGRAARAADAHRRGPSGRADLHRGDPAPQRGGAGRAPRPRDCAPRCSSGSSESRASCAGSWPRYVRHELDKPHVREARTIDVSRAIDRAWASIAPRATRRTA